MIIGIIGAKKVGKETVAKHLVHKFGFHSHSHSEILREILGILNQDLTRMNYIKLVALRKTFGEDVLINALNKRINSDLEKGPVVITGIRFQNELDNIRAFPESKIIYITAPVEKRFEWQKQHGKDKSDDSSMEYAEFNRIESEETEVGIKELGVKADYHLENHGDRDELLQQVDQIITDIQANAGK